MLNYLANKLRRSGNNLSEDKIRATLSKMQLSLIDNDGQQMYLRANLTDDMKKILRTLKIKRIPDIAKKNDLNNYISFS